MLNAREVMLVVGGQALWQAGGRRVCGQGEEAAPWGAGRGALFPPQSHHHFLSSHLCYLLSCGVDSKAWEQQGLRFQPALYFLLN